MDQTFQKGKTATSSRTIGDTTQVPHIGRVTWTAEILNNEIKQVELRSIHVAARMSMNTQGGLNRLEITRGLAAPIQISFDESGKLNASQGNQPVNNKTAQEAMTSCFKLFNHAAVHHKVAEAMMVTGGEE